MQHAMAVIVNKNGNVKGVFFWIDGLFTRKRRLQRKYAESCYSMRGSSPYGRVQDLARDIREVKQVIETEEASLRAQSAACKTLEESQNAAHVKQRTVPTAGILVMRFFVCLSTRTFNIGMHLGMNCIDNASYFSVRFCKTVK